uniref:Uncharacterized protein n=1 Tax=Myotis myotis TaxID=51298 RepID=A0A7J7YE28_MYOMY|nr:hypothetical protein mMyoMyo1_011131 [Myotis myotis]
MQINHPSTTFKPCPPANPSDYVNYPTKMVVSLHMQVSSASGGDGGHGCGLLGPLPAPGSMPSHAHGLPGLSPVREPRPPVPRYACGLPGLSVVGELRPPTPSHACGLPGPCQQRAGGLEDLAEQEAAGHRAEQERGQLGGHGSLCHPSFLITTVETDSREKEVPPPTESARISHWSDSSQRPDNQVSHSSASQTMIAGRWDYD